MKTQKKWYENNNKKYTESQKPAKENIYIYINKPLSFLYSQLSEDKIVKFNWK